MSRYLVVAVVVLAAAIPAAAAGPNPAALVLQVGDVPAGFRVVRDETAVRTNEAEARDFPETRALYRRWKRVTGYHAVYERRTSGKLEARSDLFRAASGAEAMLELTDREWMGSGISGQARASIRIGAGGVVYWSSGSYPQTLVLWRHGRVFSGLNGLGIPRAKTIALARTQQRRIAAAVG